MDQLRVEHLLTTSLEEHDYKWEFPKWWWIIGRLFTFPNRLRAAWLAREREDIAWTHREGNQEITDGIRLRRWENERRRIVQMPSIGEIVEVRVSRCCDSKNLHIKMKDVEGKAWGLWCDGDGERGDVKIRTITNY